MRIPKRKGMPTSLSSKKFIVAMLLLAILTPQSTWSQETKKEPELSPRAQQLMTQAPKTPEELLRHIKHLMDNPKVNAFDFGEKVTGIDRANWGTPQKRWDLTDYYPLGSHSPYSRRLKNRIKTPTPYRTGHITITQQNTLNEIVFRWFDDDIHLPPALTKKILGEPTDIIIQGPCEEFSNRYCIIYTYIIGKLYFKFVFPEQNINYNWDDICINNFDMKKIVERINYFKLFSNHKNMKCKTIDISPSRKHYY